MALSYPSLETRPCPSMSTPFRRKNAAPISVRTNRERFLKYFRRKTLQKNCTKIAFLIRNKAKLCKNFDHIVGF
jgi:hypothetical protein